MEANVKASPWDNVNASKEPCPRTQRSGHGLELQERGEKREKWTQTEFLVFLFSIFLSFSPLSLSLSFMSIFFFTNTREAVAIIFLCVCLPKQETFLLYLRLYKKLYYSNFRMFLSRPICMQWSTLLSASLRRLFRNL